jgi:hypothetical protein
MLVGDAFPNSNGSSAFSSWVTIDSISGNLECRTSHGVLDVSLKGEKRLYVSVAAVY